MIETPNPAQKEIDNWFMATWKRWNLKIRGPILTYFLAGGGILLFLVIIITIKQAFPQKTDKAVPTPISNNATNTLPTPDVEGATDCDTKEWKNFSSTDWLQYSWFIISNGVWSLPDIPKPQDAAIYLKSSCAGGSLIQYQITPRLDNYINVDTYIRGQLRWEIGGGDKRSIRLWKNDDGCGNGEIKHAVPVKQWFLPNHDEILVDQLLTINMATFFLSNGRIRSEIWLNYPSLKNGGQNVTTPRQTYYHDFKPGSVCDTDHLPDINSESYQFGLGLQAATSSAEPKIKLESPKVSFDKYKIGPFSSTD